MAAGPGRERLLARRLRRRHLRLRHRAVPRLGRRVTDQRARSSAWPPRRAATGWPRRTAASSTTASPVPGLHGRPGQHQPDPGHCGHARRARGTGSCPPHPRRFRPPCSSGSSGAAVATLQTQLYALGYWVDTTNGSFDDSTQQAVWALQKAANLPRDGVVGPATWAALERRGRPPAPGGVGLRDPDQPGERPDHGRQQQPPALDAQHLDRRRLHLHPGRRHQRGHHAHRASSAPSGWSTGP